MSAQLAEPEAVQAHVDPWLARRALTWGASEIATLLVAPRKRGRPAERGLELERRLVIVWHGLVARGAAGEAASMLDAASVQHVADLLPSEVLPC